MHSRDRIRGIKLLILQTHIYSVRAVELQRLGERVHRHLSILLAWGRVFTQPAGTMKLWHRT